MSQDTDLLTLQSIDDELAATRAALDSARSRLEGSESLATARANEVELQERLDALESRQRSLDAETDDLQARVQRDESRLYSGEITLVKEMNALQHEIDTLKRRNSDGEDALLSVLDEVESVSSALEAAHESVASEKRSWEIESADLRAESDRLAAEIAALEERRGEVRATIPRATIATYDNLLDRKGSAIARLTGDRCSVCRVQVPTAVRHAALGRDQLARCPNCDRIIVFGS